MKKTLLTFIIFFISLATFCFSNSASATESNLASPWFKIDVSSIYPWKESPEKTSKDTANWILGTIIQNMMIALWSISVLVMVIWSWFMILNNWDDSKVTYWKKIFMGGIYSIVISLSSYYLVAIVRFLLYNAN